MSEDEFISDEYRRLNRKYHIDRIKANNPWGVSAKKYFKEIQGMAQELKAGDILDYGCGSCSMTKCFRTNKNPIPIYEYDPCIDDKMNNKRPADLVVCTDVLEHIEKDKLDNVLYDLWAHSRKGMFLVIATVGCSEIFEDGTNAHQIVESPVWWLNKLEEAYQRKILFGRLQPKRLWVRIYKNEK